MPAHELKAKAAITGLGISEMGRLYGHDAAHFGAEAVQRAVADAGLRKADIDGLLVCPGVTSMGAMGGVGMQNYLGLTHLRLLASMNVGGATANIMVQYAALSVIHGLANHVVCVFADAPLREGRGGGAAYAASGRSAARPSGMGGLYPAFGVYGVNALYALVETRRHQRPEGSYTTYLFDQGLECAVHHAWSDLRCGRHDFGICQALVEIVRQNIYAVQEILFAPDNAQGCDGDVILFQIFIGEIGGAIGDNRDLVGHSGVIVLRMGSWRNGAKNM